MPQLWVYSLGLKYSSFSISKKVKMFPRMWIECVPKGQCLTLLPGDPLHGNQDDWHGGQLR